jgi:soluble lytic murein transglycosylase
MARNGMVFTAAALLGTVALPVLVATTIAAQDGVVPQDGLRQVVAAAVQRGSAMFDGIMSDGTVDGMATGAIPTKASLESPAGLPSSCSPSENAAVEPEIPVSADLLLPPPPLPDELQPPRPSAEVPLLRDIIDMYRKGDVGAADLSASTVQEPAGRAVLEWAAIRLQPQLVGFKRITRFMTDHPDWPGRNSLRRRAEEALVSERRDARTVLAFFADKGPLTPLGKLTYAKALAANGRTEEASALARELWRKDDFGSETEAKVIEAFPGLFTTADHRARVEREMFAEDWSGAQRAAARLGDDIVKLVKARIAVDREASDAGKQLDALPKSLKDDPSYLFARAQWLRRQDKPIDAAKALAGMTRDPDVLVNPGEWWTERRILARKLLDVGEQKLAYEVSRDYPEGDNAVTLEAEFHAGWIALRFLADKDAAARHFARAAAVAATPISVARAAYWQGRAAEAVEADASPYYRRAAEQPTTYYGQLARARLGMSELPVRRVLGPMMEPLDRLPAGRAIRLLTDAGARDLAAPLYKELAETLTSESDLDALAQIAADRNDVRAVLTVGKVALQRGFPMDNHAFPLIGMPRFDMPEQAGIDRSFIYAIARQESAFDPRAVSSAGAKGLMQLMPATARVTATRAGLGWEPDRLLSDAAYNARIGATHLSDLVRDWKGSYILTIASYNAGPGNVKKWIDAYGDPRSSAVDPIDWVERIPFTETRNYVQRVLENLQVYRSRLGERETLLIQDDLRRGSR